MFVRPGTAHLGTFPVRFPNDYPDVKKKNTKLVKTHPRSPSSPPRTRIDVASNKLLYQIISQAWSPHRHWPDLPLRLYCSKRVYMETFHRPLWKKLMWWWWGV